MNPTLARSMKLPHLSAGIDHLVLVVRELEQARQQVTDLGFEVTPRAVHENFGTANHLIVFEDSYIELLAIHSEDPPDPSTRPLIETSLRRGEGMALIALDMIDSQRTYDALRQTGVGCEEPKSWSRLADTPDGQKTARFTTLFTKSSLLPGAGTFFCQQHTPQFVRQACWSQHPNKVTSLIRLTCHVADADDDADPNSPFVRRGREPDGTLNIELGHVPVTYKRKASGPPRWDIKLRSQEKVPSLVIGNTTFTVDVD